jgi:tRNA-guanine transglycosylase
MTVGTRATVTGLTPADLREVGAQVLLGNTYHLLLRPGVELFERVGGLHRFMGWDGPVLTDSGGYQIFSLPEDRVVSEKGARFRSYTDRRMHMLSPEKSIAVQTAIGADIMMVLDVCVDARSDQETTRAAMERTHRWALRSLAARQDTPQALFAIMQGGIFPELRRASAEFLTQHPFDGFAIGGLAVGDTRAEREEVTHMAAALLPADRPRYLMGVGTPPDLLHAMLAGVDMFDCILPTQPGLAGHRVHGDGAGQGDAGLQRRRRPAARRELHVWHVPRLHAGLSAPPVSLRRGPGPAPAGDAQPPSLQRADGRVAGRDRGRVLRRVRAGEAGPDRSPRAQRSQDRRGAVSADSCEVVITRDGRAGDARPAGR